MRVLANHLAQISDLSQNLDLSIFEISNPLTQFTLPWYQGHWNTVHLNIYNIYCMSVSPCRCQRSYPRWLLPPACSLTEEEAWGVGGLSWPWSPWLLIPAPREVAGMDLAPRTGCWWHSHWPIWQACGKRSHGWLDAGESETQRF